MIPEHESVDVFIGIDVGKSNHHAVALDRSGKKLLDKALPQDEAKLKTIITSLSRHGRALLVVDQPATIGALPVAVAQAAGIMVGYLPGLAMRRIADLHPGEAKTDVLTELPKPVRDIHMGCLGVFGQRISGLSTLPWPAAGNYNGLHWAADNRAPNDVCDCCRSPRCSG